MPSLWRLVLGVGWILQPLPSSPGCVITPETSRGFGFRRPLRWVRVVLVALVLAVTVSALAWMWRAGHEVEVEGAVLAAVLIAAADSAYRELQHLVRRPFRRGGALAG